MAIKSHCVIERWFQSFGFIASLGFNAIVGFIASLGFNAIFGFIASLGFNAIFGQFRHLLIGCFRT